MRGLRGWILVCAAVMATASPMRLTAQDEIVEQGNVAYQNGDFAAAIEAYEAVIAAGFTSAGLEYNLGNAYFKAGELGRAILHWERALERAPGDTDVRANLELARSLTVDAIEPMPRFWLFDALSWWVDLLPRALLVTVVGAGWLAASGGVMLRILGRSDGLVRSGVWSVRTGVLLLIVFGTTLLARESGLIRPERGVVLVETVPVRSAPAEEDDLTLFEVHEGTRVRIDQRTGSWVEVILDDGKVGWVPVDVLGLI